MVTCTSQSTKARQNAQKRAVAPLRVYVRTPYATFRRAARRPWNRDWLVLADTSKGYGFARTRKRGCGSATKEIIFFFFFFYLVYVCIYVYRSIFSAQKVQKNKKEKQPYILYIPHYIIYRTAAVFTFDAPALVNSVPGKTPRTCLPGARFLKNAPAKRPAPGVVFAFRLS